MKHALATLILLALCSCAAGNIAEHRGDELIGLDSFALAARFGTPASYEHQDEYLQLNYGSAAAGCKVTFLVDQRQRVAGWASSGARCIGPRQDRLAKPNLNMLD